MSDTNASNGHRKQTRGSPGGGGGEDKVGVWY